MILFMPGMAFGTGAGVLVGQNLGAGKPERAERGVWLAAALVEGMILVASLAIFLWPEAIVRVFNSEQAVLDLAVPFLRIAVVGYTVVGLSAVMMMSLSSAGDTLFPMLVTVFTVWAVQLPLVIFLPKLEGLGVLGVRWAIVSGMLISTAVYVWYFRLGRWKRKKV
jgi:Na+-driven multidrug efflux pump